MNKILRTLTTAVAFGSCLSLSSCQSATKQNLHSTHQDDPYIWLEELESPRAMQWVREQNTTMNTRLSQASRFSETESDMRNIMLAKDRLPGISERKGWLYNFWQDSKNERGLWRRTTLASYRTASPKWEVLLDLDALAAKEKENWVWKGSSCLPAKNHLCLIYLSRGGKDAIVTREYDFNAKSFVEGGFSLPESKGYSVWYDENSLLASTNFGPNSMTDSGYPRQVRKLTRGQKLADAEIILEGAKADMMAWASTTVTPAGKFAVVGIRKTFYSSEMFLWQEKQKPIRLDVPHDAEALEIFQDQQLFLLRSDWKTNAHTFRGGQLISLSLKNSSEPPSLVYAPADDVFIQQVVTTSEAVFMTVLEKVKGRVLRITRNGSGSWSSSIVEGTGPGQPYFSSSDPEGKLLILRHEGFLSPTSQWILDSQKSNAKFEKIKSLPARFQAKNGKVEQFEAVSKDGTRVPYFVVSSEPLRMDGKNPTVLYGYGGFEVSVTPYYIAGIGKTWLERTKGVYVVANIRGGGEFGPEWHAAARGVKRQKAFDDFIAVAEDLIRRQITSPAHLGILGGSNGGLLVGAVTMQRPELFGAVVCQVPLLDMIRYTKLLAGDSWKDEYGDPENPEVREAILKYSPYQNARHDVAYPEIFFMTSTKDDRVHPGHARKMAAKLLEYKKPVLFYENIEGGHGAAANLEQRIRFNAYAFTFFKEKLAPETKAR